MPSVPSLLKYWPKGGEHVNLHGSACMQLALHQRLLDALEAGLHPETLSRLWHRGATQ